MIAMQTPKADSTRAKSRRQRTTPFASDAALIARSFNASPNALIILELHDNTTSIVAASRAFEALTGYRTAEIKGRNPCFFIGEDHDQPEIEELRRGLRVGKGTTATLRTYRKDGSMFWNHIRLAPVSDESGWVTHFVGSCEDVSMQKAAQTRVRRLEKMSAIGQLASGIAHDFNNILGATGAFAGLIADAVSAGSNEHLYAMRILAACQRATDLVRQLATFTRTKDAPREPLHVRDIVQEVVALLSRRLPQAVNLSVTDTTENAVVIANSSQLVQVVLNLAVNACDAMAASGGELCISATTVAAPEKEPLPHHLLLDSEREGFVYATGHLMSSQRYIRISVTDTGTGIARDIAERIFEPFFTTKDKRAGSGLGLSIVTNIVTDHEGIVCVRSRAGLGSTFHIYLPVHDVPVEPRTIHREDARVGRRETLRGDERVLIVDDEIDIADALSLSLARWGYRTQAFYNPQDALDLFALDPNAWDVVILDQTMPRMHGTELLQEMKSLRHDIKIVLCSGLAASGKSGGKGKEDAFFVKPVAADTIATAIRRLMTARAS